MVPLFHCQDTNYYTAKFSGSLSHLPKHRTAFNVYQIRDSGFFSRGGQIRGFGDRSFPTKPQWRSGGWSPSGGLGDEAPRNWRHVLKMMHKYTSSTESFDNITAQKHKLQHFQVGQAPADALFASSFRLHHSGQVPKQQATLGNGVRIPDPPLHARFASESAEVTR